MKQKFYYAYFVSLLTIFLITNYATAAPSHRSPDIAFDSVNDRYLSVYSWCANGAFCDLDINLYGKLIDNDGSPSADPQFLISDAARVQTNASVAYDSLTQRYLVVWQDDRSALDTDIYSQLVNANGSLFSDEILISQATSGNQDNPRVSYDSVNNRFLVVWQDGRNFTTSNSDIWGQIVNADGLFVGSNFAISEAAGAETTPAVAFDGDHQVFLVGWEDIGTAGSGSKGIYGQVVHADGSLEGGSFIVTSTTAADTSIKNPSIAYDNLSQNFLVVWDTSIGLAPGRFERIDGRLVKVSGVTTPPPVGFVVIGIGSSLIIYGADTLTDIRIATIDIDAQDPSVASADSGKFLVVWEDGRNVSTADFETDIYARWVNGDGSTDGVDFDVFTGLLEQNNPSIAYNSQQNNFAIAFETGPIESQDIQIEIVERDVEDLTPPVITLLGPNPLDLEVGSTYVEPGATATDDVDGDISADIVITGTVDTDTLGTDTVNYDVSDAAGNPAHEERTVNIVDTTAPTFELSVPGDGATDATVDTNIEVRVRDSGSEVNQSSIVMTVEGVDVTLSLSFAGVPSDYTATYNPPADFANGQEVNVTVSATDVAGNSGSDSFSFLTVAGSVWDPVGDEDNDGIPNGVEEDLLHTDPTMKTLFIRPKEEIGFLTYQYWGKFKTLFPWPGRDGVAKVGPLYDAGIEVVVIGASDNPYYDAVRGVWPMRAFDYDPKTDPNHPPCNIMEVVFKEPTDYCTYNVGNEGHTYFAGITWTWDTKGYTPRQLTAYNYTEYDYHTPIIYPFPLNKYFTEGAYTSIAAGQTPVTASGCSYPHCYDYNYASPMNLNAGDPVNGTPDTTVEHNGDHIILFNASTEAIDSIVSIGSVLSDEDKVLRRTLVHEIGHGLLNALGSVYDAGDPEADRGDHCEEDACIMNKNTPDWELHSFGSNSCVHSVGGAKNIRANGIVHNSIHLP